MGKSHSVIPAAFSHVVVKNGVTDPNSVIWPTYGPTLSTIDRFAADSRKSGNDGEIRGNTALALVFKQVF